MNKLITHIEKRIKQLRENIKLHEGLMEGKTVYDNAWSTREIIIFDSEASALQDLLDDIENGKFEDETN